MSDYKTLSNSPDILFFDTETSIFNKGNYADPRNFLVSYAVRCFGHTSFHYYTDPGFIRSLNEAISSCKIIVGFNIKFDLHWCLNRGISVPLTTKIWDLQLAEFIYAGQELHYDSLDAAMLRYGLPTKPDLVKDYWERGISTEHIPVPILEEYNKYDVSANEMLFNVQQGLLSEKQKQLVLIEGEDLRALMHAEHAGIKWDMPAAENLVATRTEEINNVEEQLCTYLPTECKPEWFNFDSGDHLSALLYGGALSFDWFTSQPAVYKSGAKAGQEYEKRSWQTTEVYFPKRFQPLEGTEVKKCTEPGYKGTMFYQVDQPSLSQLKTRMKENRVLLDLLKVRSENTKVAEMAESIMNKIAEKNWQDSYIHPQYNQNVVITGRLSSSQPNMQNTPPEIDELLVSRYD